MTLSGDNVLYMMKRCLLLTIITQCNMSFYIHSIVDAATNQISNQGSPDESTSAKKPRSGSFLGLLPFGGGFACVICAFRDEEHMIGVEVAVEVAV